MDRAFIESVFAADPAAVEVVFEGALVIDPGEEEGGVAVVVVVFPLVDEADTGVCRGEAVAAGLDEPVAVVRTGEGAVDFAASALVHGVGVDEGGDRDGNE